MNSVVINERKIAIKGFFVFENGGGFHINREINENQSIDKYEWLFEIPICC